MISEVGRTSIDNTTAASSSYRDWAKCELGGADILEKMHEHECQPNSLSCNFMIYGFCKEKKMDRAVEYSKRMVSRGC